MPTTRRLLTMGLLLSALANCGSRKADGSPNASGQVFLYKAGTIQQEFGYADAGCTVPLTTTAGAVVLDGAGKRTIYMKAPADVVVADSTGTPIDSIPAFNNHRAELVEVQNANYTGKFTDPATLAVSQALGGLTDLNAILSAAASSLGPNFKYLAGAGGTQRNVQDWMRNVGIFAGDFGALFDGKTDDTTAIQKAINFVASLGGGKVLLPPGTAIIGTGGLGLVISTSGTVLQGAGRGITTLKCASTTVVAVTSNATTAFTVRGITVTNSGAGSVAGISVAATGNVQVDDIEVNSYATGLLVNAVTGITISHCLLSGSTHDLSFTGAGGTIAIIGSNISNTGMAFDNNAYAGVTLIGNATNGVVPTFAAGALPTSFYQAGNGLDVTNLSSAIGGTLTPVLEAGHTITLKAASGGAGTETVANPATLPSAGQAPWTLIFVNASGGAVTWAFGTAYKMSAIPTTDGHTIVAQVQWDALSSKLRLISFTDLAT